MPVRGVDIPFGAGTLQRPCKMKRSLANLNVRRVQPAQNISIGLGLRGHSSCSLSVWRLPSSTYEDNRGSNYALGPGRL
jgi:hypothetical protein